MIEEQVGTCPVLLPSPGAGGAAEGLVYTRVARWQVKGWLDGGGVHDAWYRLLTSADAGVMPAPCVMAPRVRELQAGSADKSWGSGGQSVSWRAGGRRGRPRQQGAARAADSDGRSGAGAAGRGPAHDGGGRKRGKGAARGGALRRMRPRIPMWVAWGGGRGRTEGTRSWDAPAGWPARHSKLLLLLLLLLTVM